MVRQRGKKNTAQKSNEQLVIPEDEQWRLVNESGLLKTFGNKNPEVSTEEPDEVPPADDIFDAVFLIIPFSFLLLIMDMSVLCQSLIYTSPSNSRLLSLIHLQYNKEIRSQELGGRILTRVPSKVQCLRWIFF